MIGTLSGQWSGNNSGHKCDPCGSLVTRYPCRHLGTLIVLIYYLNVSKFDTLGPYVRCMDTHNTTLTFSFSDPVLIAWKSSLQSTTFHEESNIVNDCMNVC